jgi:HAMP domain-containing protein
MILLHQTESGALKGGFAALKVGLIANALAAISIGPVPITWMGMAWMLAVSVILIWYPLRLSFRGWQAIWIFLLWALIVQALNIGENWRMPDGATTSYPVYVVLRYVTILTFMATLGISFWLILKGYREKLIYWLVNFAVVLSLVAMYVYLAHRFGWPDIPRTRPNTTTGEIDEEVVFTYAFHRAIGTFREPGDMAQWLVLPLFLSFYGRSLVNWKAVVIGAAILLTGSLTGILSIAIGGLVAWFWMLARGNKGNRWLLKIPLTIALLALVASVPFYLMVQGQEGGTIHLYEVVRDRVGPIIAGGIAESNRGYPYEYVAATDLPIVGDGLGNATIKYTQFFSSHLLKSFLSLYLSTLYSLGVIGLALLLWFLSRPLTAPTRKVPSRDLWPMLSAYIAWLVIFAVGPTEFAMIFGISYALLGTAHRVAQA